MNATSASEHVYNARTSALIPIVILTYGWFVQSKEIERDRMRHTQKERETERATDRPSALLDRINTNLLSKFEWIRLEMHCFINPVCVSNLNWYLRFNIIERLFIFCWLFPHICKMGFLSLSVQANNAQCGCWCKSQ